MFMFGLDNDEFISKILNKASIYKNQGRVVRRLDFRSSLVSGPRPSPNLSGW